MLDRSVPLKRVVMVKHSSDFPHYFLRDEFSFTPFRRGDETAWGALLHSLGQAPSPQAGAAIIEREFLYNPALAEERCVFVRHGEELVAAAALWQGDLFGDAHSRIHWVSTAARYQGIGLAKALLTRLLQLHERLESSSFLYLTSSTQSWRALPLYAKFGFVPYRGERPVNCGWQSFEADSEEGWRLIEEKIRCEGRGAIPW